MNTSFPSDVVRKTGPRGVPGTRRVGWYAYYIGGVPRHTLVSGPRNNKSSERTTSLASLGGQYAAPIGTSTKDKTDAQDLAERLADFEAALEQAKYGTLADVAW